MKITERYIKMCEKAEEIQREWKPQRGDRCIEKKGKTVYPLLVIEIDFIYCSDYGLRVFTVHGELIKVLQSDLTWLPTQEQLQEMYMNMSPDIDWVEKGAVTLESDFSYVVTEENWEYFVQFGTMNELWLAFVMWERYGKVWDDEKEEWFKGGEDE